MHPQVISREGSSSSFQVRQASEGSINMVAQKITGIP